MKKILFGIALILFSLVCMVIAIPGEIGVFFGIGVVVALCGMLFAVIGFFGDN